MHAVLRYDFFLCPDPSHTLLYWKFCIHCAGFATSAQKSKSSFVARGRGWGRRRRQWRIEARTLLRSRAVFKCRGGERRRVRRRARRRARGRERALLLRGLWRRGRGRAAVLHDHRQLDDRGRVLEFHSCLHRVDGVPLGAIGHINRGGGVLSRVRHPGGYMVATEDGLALARLVLSAAARTAAHARKAEDEQHAGGARRADDDGRIGKHAHDDVAEGSQRCGRRDMRMGFWGRWERRRRRQGWERIRDRRRGWQRRLLWRVRCGGRSGWRVGRRWQRWQGGS